MTRPSGHFIGGNLSCGSFPEKSSETMTQSKLPLVPASAGLTVTPRIEAILEKCEVIHVAC
jgi:hypothetical protein